MACDGTLLKDSKEDFADLNSSDLGQSAAKHKRALRLFELNLDFLFQNHVNVCEKFSEKSR